MRDSRAGNSSASRLLWVAIAVISVLFIIAISYAFYGENGAVSGTTQERPMDSVDTVASARQTVAETDSDKDGIPDWEEVLWGTDPNNPDSDGNGVQDSRSTRSDSGWRSAFKTGASSSEFASGTNNTTAVAAQELIGSYLMEIAQKNSAGITPQEQALLVEQALRASGETFKPPTVSLNELASVSSSPQASAQYVRDMTAIFNDWLEGAELDYELMKDLTTDNRSSATEGLDRSVQHYATIVDRLKRVSVPQDALQNHQSMVNALLGYSFMVESIRNMESDPVKATAAVQLVLKYDEALAVTVRTFGAYSAAHASQ